MSKFHLLTAMFTLVAGALAISSVRMLPVFRGTASPSAQFDAESIDLGVREPGDACDCGFVLHNRGGDTLRIERLSTSCGCAPAEAGTTAISPRESTSIHVRFRLPERAGTVSHTVTVRTNDRRRPEIVLRVSAAGHHAVDVRPSLLTIRAMGENETQSETLTLSSPTGESFAISAIESDVPGLEFSFDRERTLSRHVVQARFVRTSHSAARMGAATVRTTHPRRPVLRLPVEVTEAASRPAVAPSLIQLGVLEPQSTHVARIATFVRSPPDTLSSGEPIIRCIGDGWRIEKTEARPLGVNSLEHSIELRVPKDPGWHRALLQIRCGDASVHEVPVHCEISGRSP